MKSLFSKMCTPGKTTCNSQRISTYPLGDPPEMSINMYAASNNPTTQPERERKPNLREIKHGIVTLPRRFSVCFLLFQFHHLCICKFTLTAAGNGAAAAGFLSYSHVFKIDKDSKVIRCIHRPVRLQHAPTRALPIFALLRGVRATQTRSDGPQVLASE